MIRPISLFFAAISIGWSAAAAASAWPTEGTPGGPASTNVAPEIWAKITPQLKATRYAFSAVENGGFKAENPAQDFEIVADAAGVRVKNSVVLHTVQIGTWALPQAVHPIARGARLEYRRPATGSGLMVTEWFENREAGLEQGFTIAKLPAPADRTDQTDPSDPSDLRLLVAVAGARAVAVDADGLSARITDEQGRAFGYSGLKAWDATGRELPCRMESAPTATGNRPPAALLRIVCDARQAVYPVTIDPILTSLEKKLTVADGAANDYFGWAVAAAGDVVVVGAYGDDDLGSSSGTAYIFERNAGGTNAWGQVKKLTAADGTNDNFFGYAVAAAGDVVVVGAYGNASNKGAAYVFERNAGGTNAWGQVGKLVAADGAAGDKFGWAVAAAGDVIAVGAPEDDEPLSASGAAFVFERNAGGTNAWGQVKKLTASDGATDDHFGYAVAAAGDVVVAGASWKSSSRGAAYLFERNAGGINAWREIKKLMASDGVVGDAFGSAVAAAGDVVVIGAYGDDDLGSSSGAAYVFERNASGTNAWGEVRKLIAADGTTNDAFGVSVAVAGDVIVAGAYGNDEYGSASGAAYVFERNADGTNAWGQVKKLTAADATTNDLFGIAVAAAGDLLVSGAYGNASFKGAAYIDFVQSEQWNQKSKLTASDGSPSDKFGAAVAAAGDVIVAGAERVASYRGAAYVFERNAGGTNAWGQMKKLTAADAAADDAFGYAVAVDGDILAVGAYCKSSYEGAAYVFERNAGGTNAWGQVKKLTAADAAPNDYFGGSVAVAGDVVAVGAFGKASYRGAVYLFERNAGGTNNWGQVKKLTAADAAASDSFGQSLAADGDVLAVGAFSKASFQGAAYVFERNAGGTNAWGQVGKLTAADGAASDDFGWVVGAAGDVVAVGAYGKDSSRGAAYVFERNAGGTNNWGQVKKLTAADGAMTNRFGIGMAVAGDMVLVGADGSGESAGALYVFARHADGTNAWGQTRKLTAADEAANDAFGYAVAAAGDAVVAGAYQQNSSQGAAYVFEGLIFSPVMNVLGTNGAIIASGAIASTTNGTDFGSVPWGQVATNTFVITNSGYARLTISGIATNGSGAAAFQIPDWRFEIPVGRKTNCAIRFAPPNAGTYTAAVYFANNSTATPFIVRLAGTGAKQNQAITNFTPTNGSVFMTTSTVGLAAQASSGLPVTNFTVDSGPGNIAGLTNLTFTGSGQVSLVANQAGNTNWNSAPPVTNTFSVTKVAQAALTFSPASPQVYHTTNALSATGGSGTGAMSFAVLSGPGQIVGTTNLWITSGTGMVQVAATKAADAMYHEITATAQVAAATASQTINFPELADQVVTSKVGLSATAASGLPVSFAVASGPGALSAGTNLSFAATGTVSIVASQAGDSNWNAAAAVTNTFNVNKADQTITFPMIPDQVVTNQVDLAATASSGLPVGFAVISGPAALSYQNTLALTGTGRVVVAASQAGDSNWNAALDVTNSFNVTASAIPAPQNLAASDGRYADKVLLSWSAPGSATGYQVWRHTANDSAAASLLGATPQTNYSDTGAAGGQIYYYWVKATNASAVSAFSAPDSGWRRSVGHAHYADLDLDGDRKADLVIFDPSSGAWRVKLSASGYAEAGTTFGGLTSTLVPADYDGDGKVDPAIYEEATGLWTILLSAQGYSPASVTLGGMGFAPTPGDFDGDRKADLGVYQAASGGWTLKLSASGYAEAGTSFGGPEYLPVQRDYDGDGKYDPAIYHITDGTWRIMLSGNGYSVATVAGFGGTGYAPIVGDYDGDGKADPAIYHEATGLWTVMLSGSGYLIAYGTLGGTGYAALPADYDGDGKTDPAVYNSSSGEWLVMLSGSGYGIAIVVFGGEGYEPVGLRAGF